jgi:hypothetical protein
MLLQVFDCLQRVAVDCAELAQRTQQLQSTVLGGRALPGDSPAAGDALAGPAAGAGGPAPDAPLNVGALRATALLQLRLGSPRAALDVGSTSPSIPTSTASAQGGAAESVSDSAAQLGITVRPMLPGSQLCRKTTRRCGLGFAVDKTLEA